MMKKFELTMMCSACKWKITSELESKGFQHFKIDMDSSSLTFQDNVLSAYIISIVNKIGYKIVEIDVSDQ
jgi:copper chaperone CopZ